MLDEPSDHRILRHSWWSPRATSARIRSPPVPCAYDRVGSEAWRT